MRASRESKFFMVWIPIVFGGLLALVLVIALIGLFLPREHKVTLQLDLPVDADAMWRVIADFAVAPARRRDGLAPWREARRAVVCAARACAGARKEQTRCFNSAATAATPAPRRDITKHQHPNPRGGLRPGVRQAGAPHIFATS